MTLDLTKPLRKVRGHYPVRIHATNLEGVYPVLVTIKFPSGWRPRLLTADGRLFPERWLDNKPYIENIPEKCIYERWVNVYEGDSSVGLHDNRADADCWAAPYRIACLHIRHEYEPGEGLE